MLLSRIVDTIRAFGGGQPRVLNGRGSKGKARWRRATGLGEQFADLTFESIEGGVEQRGMLFVLSRNPDCDAVIREDVPSLTGGLNRVANVLQNVAPDLEQFPRL